MKNPAIRAARKEDLPQIVALLADDDLGSGPTAPCLPHTSRRFGL